MINSLKSDGPKPLAALVGDSVGVIVGESVGDIVGDALVGAEVGARVSVRGINTVSRPCVTPLMARMSTVTTLALFTFP